MSAEPSASIWEVTRLILDSPERSPSEIAQEHGYSAADIAELMPIFLDTARTDWSRLADDANGWTTPAGLDAGSQDAELYLHDLAESRSIEVAGFDAPADAPDLDLEDVAAPDTAAIGDPLPPDLGELLDDLAGGELVDRDGRDSLDGSGLDEPEDPDGVVGVDGPVRLDAPISAPLVATGPPTPDPTDLVPSQTAAEITPALATPDDGLELGDDDPFGGNSSDDLAADDLTAIGTPEAPADVEPDDAGDPFTG